MIVILAIELYANIGSQKQFGNIHFPNQIEMFLYKWNFIKNDYYSNWKKKLRQKISFEVTRKSNIILS